MGFLKTFEGPIYAVMRILFGVFFALHGGQKLTGFLDDPASAEQLGPLFWPATVLELAGGLMIALGFYSRIAAFLCSGMMAFAYFVVHVGKIGGILPLQNQGEPAALYCWIFLFIAAKGPGIWSANDK